MSLKFTRPQAVCQIAWKRMDGYRITAAFKPGVGFSNSFYIYVVERQGPGDPLVPIPMGPPEEVISAANSDLRLPIARMCLTM